MTSLFGRLLVEHLVYSSSTHWMEIFFFEKASHKWRLEANFEIEISKKKSIVEHIYHPTSTIDSIF